MPSRGCASPFASQFWAVSRSPLLSYFSHLLWILYQPNIPRLRKAIPTAKWVTIALWRIAREGSFCDSATHFDVGKSTCVKITWEFCRTLTQLSSHYIEFLITCLETTRAKLFFRTSQKNPHAVGAIDETHFEIVALESHFSYFDHQHPYSVIMQAVVGGNLMFLDIVISYPGSMHNAQVLRNTKQFRKVDRFWESQW